MLFVEQAIRNETAEEVLHDERPSHGKAVMVVGTGIDHVVVRRMG